MHTRPSCSAQSRSPTRLALHCTIRYLLRLTILVSRVAPPRVLSPTRIPASVFTESVRKSGCFRVSLGRSLRLSQRRQGSRTCLGWPDFEIGWGDMGFPPFMCRYRQVSSARPLVLKLTGTDSGMPQKLCTSML